MKLLAALSCVSILLFFVTSRYRLTFVPLLAVLGAVGLRPLWLLYRRHGVETWRHLGWRAAAWPLAALLVLTPVAQSDFRALDRYNTASHLLERGLAEAALEQADQGLLVEPGQPDLHFVRGNALFGLDRLPEARAAYERTIALHPPHAQAYCNLAVVLKLQGDRAGALREAQRALHYDPALGLARDLVQELTDGHAP